MTYIYYKTSVNTGEPKISDKQLEEWKHLSTKKNWRITQLPNGYYQTEVNNKENLSNWVDVTRRETIEGAEAAIESSVEHFAKKLEYIKGPKVVKTFK
jgi:CRISPR/Cas system CSM-associated protein Csm4 (group 5 of RAMP superfamily)